MQDKASQAMCALQTKTTTAYYATGAYETQGTKSDPLAKKVTPVVEEELLWFLFKPPAAFTSEQTILDMTRRGHHQAQY